MKKVTILVFLYLIVSTILSVDIEKEKIDKKLYYIVEKNGIDVFEFPDIKSPTIANLPFNFKLKLTEHKVELSKNQGKTWLKISFLNKTGWILENNISDKEPFQKENILEFYEIENFCGSIKIEECIETQEREVLSRPIPSIFAKRIGKSIILNHIEGNSHKVSDIRPEFRSGLTGYKYRIIDYLHKFNLFVIYGYMPSEHRKDIINSGRILLFSTIGSYNLFRLEARKEIKISPNQTRIVYSTIRSDTCMDCQLANFYIVKYNNYNGDFDIEYSMEGDRSGFEFEDPVWISDEKIMLKQWISGESFDYNQRILKFDGKKWNLL